MWVLGAKVWDRSPPPTDSEAPVTTVTADTEKNATHRPESSDNFETDHESIDKDLQDGVHRVEAVTSAWSFQTLIIAYCL